LSENIFSDGLWLPVVLKKGKTSQKGHWNFEVRHPRYEYKVSNTQNTTKLLFDYYLLLFMGTGKLNLIEE
jgi:hypothetical protein